MFLYGDSPKRGTALLNKEKYEQDLKKCNKFLRSKSISLRDKYDYLIERGNLLLELIPSRNSYNTKKKVLEDARKTYDLAFKSIKKFKKKQDLRRALNQIEEKQKKIQQYENYLKDPNSLDNLLINLGNYNYILIISFTFLISTLFFFSVNLTGAVTGTAKSDFSFLGIILFIAGLITAFIYFRKERKRFEKMGVI